MLSTLNNIDSELPLRDGNLVFVHVWHLSKPHARSRFMHFACQLLKQENQKATLHPS